MPPLLIGAPHGLSNCAMSRDITRLARDRDPEAAVDGVAERADRPASAGADDRLGRSAWRPFDRPHTDHHHDQQCERAKHQHATARSPTATDAYGGYPPLPRTRRPHHSPAQRQHGGTDRLALWCVACVTHAPDRRLSEPLIDAVSLNRRFRGGSQVVCSGVRLVG